MFPPQICQVLLFIGRDGDAVSFVQTDPGFVAASIERRVGR